MLAENADVVVDDFRPGSLERQGIDPASLLRRNPRLICCTITGFGPDSARPGYDIVAQAECGRVAISGEPEGDPMNIGIALADVLAGRDAAMAILPALIERSRTGRGRRIFISLQASASAGMINVAQNVLVSGREAVRWGNAHPNLVPYQLFRAADRPIVVAVGSDAQWEACARALGLDELAVDSSLAMNAGRVAAHRNAFERRRNPALPAAAIGRARGPDSGPPLGSVRGLIAGDRIRYLQKLRLVSRA